MMSKEDENEYLREKVKRLNGDIANLVAAANTEGILEEVLRKMISDRDAEIAKLLEVKR